jgi:hypothetical protein
LKLINILILFSFLCVFVVLSACGKTAPVTTEHPSPTIIPSQFTIQPAIETPAAGTEATALPPDPQPITITTEDGGELHGYYYPAAVNPAPLVVLMHWSGGDMSDWYAIAPWLQNRGLVDPFPNPGDPKLYRWWDASWFPVIPADRSYGVLIFTFRGCVNSRCTIYEDPWLQDVHAAMLKAYDLESFDQARIVTIGSSVGADGAVIGCEFLNEQHPGACKGALSLSPGSFRVLTLSTITHMGKSKPSTPAWCIADELDFTTCRLAENAGNPSYKDFLVPNGGHGNNLLRPDLDPLPMQIILNFLSETLK